MEGVDGSSKMLKGPKNAQFNVKRANVIVQGTANMLASSAARKLIPGLNVAAGAGKKAGGMVLKGVKKGRDSPGPRATASSALGWVKLDSQGS